MSSKDDSIKHDVTQNFVAQSSDTDSNSTRTRSFHQPNDLSGSGAYRPGTTVHPEVVTSVEAHSEPAEQPADTSDSFTRAAQVDSNMTNRSGPREADDGSNYPDSRGGQGDAGEEEEPNSLSLLIHNLETGDYCKSIPKDADHGSLFGHLEDQNSIVQPRQLRGPGLHVTRSRSEDTHSGLPTPSPRHSMSLIDEPGAGFHAGVPVPAVTTSPGLTTDHSTLTSDHTVHQPPQTVIHVQSSPGPPGPHVNFQVPSSHLQQVYLSAQQGGSPQVVADAIPQPFHPGYPGYYPHGFWPPYLHPANAALFQGGAQYAPPAAVAYPATAQYPYDPRYLPAAATAQPQFRSLASNRQPPKPAPRPRPKPAVPPLPDDYMEPSPIYETPDYGYEVPVLNHGTNSSSADKSSTPPPLPSGPRPNQSQSSANISLNRANLVDVRPKEYSGRKPVSAEEQKVKKRAPLSPGDDLMSGALAEKEAMQQFRLSFQKASLKEKLGNLDEALEEYNMALYYEIQARGEHSVEIAKTHKVIAALCRKACKSAQAVEHLEQAISICTKYGLGASSDLLWTLHDDLAQSYCNVDPVKEIESYKKAIEILRLSTDIPPVRLAHMHNNLGNCYRKRKDYDLSEMHLTKSKEMMQLIQTDVGDDELAKVHQSLADLYKDQEKFDKAIEEYEECLKVYSQSAKKGVGRVLSRPIHQALVEIYELFGESDKASKHRKEADINTDELSLEDQGALKELAKKAGLNLGLPHAAQEYTDKAQMCQREGNTQMAIQHYNSAIREVERLPEKQKNEEILTQLAMLHNNVGNAYRTISRLPEAKTHIQKALEIRRMVYADEPCDATATALFNLGYVYANLPGIENQVEALNLHRECLEMYMKLGGTNKHAKWIIALHRSIASNCYNLGEIPGSIESYEKAREVINAQGGDLVQLQAVCNNVGNSYKAAKRWKEAEENLQSALNLATIMRDEDPQNLELENDIAAAQNNLGCLYQEMGSYEKAVNHHLVSLEIRERIAPHYAEAATDLPSSLHNIANAYSSEGNRQEALRYYEKEVQVRTDLREDTREVFLSMAALHQRHGDYSEAEACISRAH